MLHMYQMCQAFEFKHLPAAGGLMDQNPDFIDKFMTISQAVNAEEKKKQEAEKRRNAPPTPRNR